MSKRKGTFRVAWKPIAGGVALSTVLALAAPIAFAATQPAATSTPAVSAAVVKGAADTQSASSFTRLGGANREATAIAIANAAYPNGARTVVLVDGSQQHFIDALTAVPLAKLLDAPILLASDTDGQTPVVSGATQSEIQSLGATTVYLVGYANAVSVRNTLPKSVQHVVELQGKNRYETSGLIAKTLLQISGESSFHTIFVVSGEDSHFVDALAAGPFAANLEAPILLAQSNGALPSQQGYTASVQASYVVGMAGNYAVSVPDPTVIRGDNRYDTSQLLNQQLADGMAPYKDVIVVDAADTHLIDALTVSPYAAMLHAPVVMSNDVSASTLPVSTQDFLASHYPSAAHVIVVGGSGSVSDAIGKDVVQRVARQVVAGHFSGQVEAGTETALSFTIKDGLGNPLEGIPIDFAATGKLDATKNLSTTSAVSDANGNVQVNLHDTYVGDQGTVTATVRGTNISSATPVLTVVAPAGVAIVAENMPTAIPAGLYQNVSFVVKDGQGKPLPNVAVDVATTGNFQPGQLSAQKASTDNEGRISVTLRDSTVGDTGSVTATIQGTNISAATPPLTVVSVAGTTITAPQVPPTFPSGQWNALTFTVRNVNGNPIQGIAVDFAATGNFSANQLSQTWGVTDANGQVSVSLRDQYEGDTGTVTAVIRGTNVSATTGLITISSKTVATITATQYTATNLPAGQYNPLTFVVKDYQGDPVEGVQVNFGATGNLSAANLSQSSQISDAHGEVHVSLYDVHVGDQGTVVASVDGTNISAATGTLTIVAQPATISAPRTAPEVTAGSYYPLTFTVRDPRGTPLNGVQVIFGTTGAFNSSNLSATSGYTDADGHITVNLKETYVGQQGTVKATIAGTNVTAETSTIAVTSPDSATIAVDSQPAATVTPGTLTPVRFVVRSSDGLPLQGVKVDFTVTGTLQSSDLSDGSSYTDADGLVTVNLQDRISGHSGTVVARIEGTNQSTATRTLTIGVAASSIAWEPIATAPSTQPAILTVGQINPLKFVVKDNQGQPLANVPVDFGTTGFGGKDVLSTSTGQTDANGEVTVNLYDTVVGDTGTVTATVHGTALSTTTPSLSIQTPVATVDANYSQDADLPAGQYSDVTFTVRDSQGHPAKQVPLSVTVQDFASSTLELSYNGTKATGPSATLSATTDENGQVTVQLLDSRIGDAGTVIATVGDGSNKAGQTATLTMVLPASAQIAPEDESTIDGGTSPITLQFVVKNGSSGRALDNVPVDFAATGNLTPLGTLTPSSGTTASDGTISVLFTSSLPGSSGKVTATIHGTNTTAFSGTIAVP